MGTVSTFEQESKESRCDDVLEVFKGFPSHRVPSDRWGRDRERC